MFATIRIAKQEDIEAMTDLLEELFFIESYFVIDSQKQKIGLKLLLKSQNAKVWVAEKDDKIVGMCTMQQLLSTAEGGIVGLIEDVIIQKKYRCQGIGHHLLFYAEQFAKQAGLLRLQLLTDSNNESAMKFYEKENWGKTRLIAFRKK